MCDKCVTVNDSVASVQDISECRFREGHNEEDECSKSADSARQGAMTK